MAVGAGKQRALLALLLLHRNDVVSVDRLLDGLWDQTPPSSARKAIQVYVSRLRKVLGADRIRTSGRGYVVEVRPGELDLDRFEELVAEARELRAHGETAQASAALREALALWHGSPLADLAGEPFAETEVARLEGLRVAAIEERMDAELALGHGAELVNELESLVAQHPYRERLRGQLILALYRAGRQADALACYQDARRRFVDELGIEPGRALQRLERAILRQDAGLDALLEEVDEEPRAGAEPVEPAPTARDIGWLRRSRRRPLLALVGLLLAGSVAAFAVARATKANYLRAVDANAIGVVDAKGMGIERQVALGWRSNAIASDGHTVWTTDADGDTISRIEPHRLPVLGNLGANADGIAYGLGSLWVTNGLKRTLLQLDPQTFEVVQRFPVGNGPRAVAVGNDAIWVANTIDGTVIRIDRDTGTPGDPISVGPSPVGIAVGAGGVWISIEETGKVVRIDPRSSQVVAQISVGNGPNGIAYAGKAVWVANRDDGTVWRIDPATNKVTQTIEVGNKPTAVAAGGGSVWVANAGDATITRIRAEDPAGRPRTLRLGNDASALAFADGKVWVTTVSAGGHRGGVLRVESSPSACPSVDPVEWPGYCLVPPLVYDGLVAYRRRGGVAGERLVPNLAVRIPPPTDEGRTYTFQLRPGLSYSNGTPVLASDFRSSIERRMRLTGPGLLAGIVGARRCGAARCDLSRGIRVDDRTRTITIRLTAADPELLHKLALPPSSIVPADTPVRLARTQPVPTIGPYQVAAVEAREIKLVRNEHFRPWAPEARPDGYPDEIRFRLRTDAKAQLAAVQQGGSDWVDVRGAEPRETKGLLTRYAGRLQSNPASSWSYWLFLNTRVPPFDDVRARRAVNYAVDRRRLIDLNGEPGEPSCQILPPILPGYGPYCPYTRYANDAGTWSAPDLARGRALVKASRTTGMRVEVDTPGPRAAVSSYVASVLRKLGYAASVRHFDDPAAYYSYVADSRNRAQIGWAGWVPDYLAASNFLRALFTCDAFVPRSPTSLNLFEYCDPALDAKMEHAAALQESDPLRAGELWADVDRALVDRAVTVPWSVPRQRVLLSNRVGNYQGHPLWGTLFDQLWVK